MILLEDDMLLSSDFLHYFRATAPLLAADPTIWCAEGKKSHTSDDWFVIEIRSDD